MNWELRWNEEIKEKGKELIGGTISQFEIYGARWKKIEPAQDKILSARKTIENGSHWAFIAFNVGECDATNGQWKVRIWK